MGWAVTAAPKSPRVKWGQKPDRLYLTVMMPDAKDPIINVEEKKVYIKGESRGEQYELEIPLLRPINTTESSHQINAWSVTFDLKKMRKEPCWLRLTRSKATHAWLKKDTDRVYADECQYAKEQWREAYFSAKMKGEEPGEKKEKKPGEVDEPDDKKREKAEWEKTLEEFRKKAVLRPGGEKAQALKAKKKKEKAAKKGKK